LSDSQSFSQLQRAKNKSVQYFIGLMPSFPPPLSAPARPAPAPSNSSERVLGTRGPQAGHTIGAEAPMQASIWKIISACRACWKAFPKSGLSLAKYGMFFYIPSA
jgi:hypothetical protein